MQDFLGALPWGKSRLAWSCNLRHWWSPFGGEELVVYDSENTNRAYSCFLALVKSKDPAADWRQRRGRGFRVRGRLLGPCRVCRRLFLRRWVRGFDEVSGSVAGVRSRPLPQRAPRWSLLAVVDYDEEGGLGEVDLLQAVEQLLEEGGGALSALRTMFPVRFCSAMRASAMRAAPADLGLFEGLSRLRWRLMFQLGEETRAGLRNQTGGSAEGLARAVVGLC